MSILLDNTDHILLLIQQEPIHRLHHCRALDGTSVQLKVNDAVVNAVQAEIHQACQNRLGTFTQQEFFQIVIAQRGELDINLAYNANLFLGTEILIGNLREPLADQDIQHFHMAVVDKFIRLKILGDLSDQCIHSLITVTLVDLIRPALVIDMHDKVTQQYTICHLNECLGGQLKARIGILLQSGEVQGNDRDITHAIFNQCFAQQMNIIGGTAAAAGLGNHNSNLMQVIFARFQRVNKLADNQQCRITGVIMYIFQAALRNLRAFCFQNLHVVAVILHDGSNQLQLHRQHIGNQNGIILFHVLRKRDMWKLTTFRHCFFPPLQQQSYCGYGSLPHQDC